MMKKFRVRCSAERKNRLKDLGVYHVWIDRNGHLYIECPLCDSIRHDLLGHLKFDHVNNPVAQKIVANIESERLND